VHSLAEAVNDKDERPILMNKQALVDIKLGKILEKDQRARMDLEAASHELGYLNVDPRELKLEI
jgi:hypothetical protein